MASYEFTTITQSYGTVRAVVTSDDQDAVNFLDPKKIANDGGLISKAITPAVLKTVKWQLFTVKVATTDGLQIKEVQPLTKAQSLLALTEMKIRQNQIYDEQEGLSYASLMAKTKKARAEAGLALDVAKLGQVDIKELSNQRTLTLLALRNSANIIASDTMQS